jgi:peptidoglycan/xylan/chitin deacetylase (PgdA/CDA1 family)
MTRSRPTSSHLAARPGVIVSLAVTLTLLAVQAGPVSANPPLRRAGRLTIHRAATTCPPANHTVRSVAPGRGRTVALTFDDGPGTSTTAILKTLMRKGVRATFFNVGEQLGEHSPVARTEVRQGHTVGNHTWDHADLRHRNAAEQGREMDRESAAQRRLTGTTPCLFRPPYGNYDSTTLHVAASRHLATWLWSVDTEDWKAEGSDARSWVRRITKRAEAGPHQRHPVILMHNADGPGDPATVEALPRIIHYFRARHYAFVGLRGNHGFAPYAPDGRPGPALVAANHALHLFTASADHRLTERTEHAGRWGSARALGGASVTGLGAVAVDGGSASLVAATTPAHEVRVRTVRGGSTGAWRTIGRGVRGRPAIAADPLTDTVTLATRTAAGEVEVRQRIRGTWRPSENLGGRMSTAPAVVTTRNGTETVAAVGFDGVLRITHDDGAGWSAWRRVAGTTTADPALVTTTNRRRPVILARSQSGVIRARVGDPDGHGWRQWHALASKIAVSGAAATLYRGLIHVAVLGTDRRFYLMSARTGTGGLTVRRWHPVP